MSKVIELDWNPSDKTLRDFGFIALVGFGGLAAMAWFEALVFSFGLGAARVPVAAALSGLSLLCAVFSLVAPRANRPIYLGLSMLTYPVGLVVSYVLMASLFFLLFAPLGIAFRLFGRDSLHRGLDDRAETYWRKGHPPRAKDRYFRQF